MQNVNILNPKPKTPLVYSPLSWRPSRNYIRHVLYSDIQQFQPKHSLDAACGDLAHYWMFETGEYWGIDIGYITILRGLSSKNKKIINKRGSERIKLINGDILRHIDGLGPFDLVVSTSTLGHIPAEYIFHVVKSMVQTISVGGNLILTDITPDNADNLLPYLSGQFTNVDVLYHQSLESQAFENANVSVVNQEDLRMLTVEFEMNCENDPKLHTNTYLRCSSRKTGLSYSKPRPIAARLTNHDIFAMEDMPIPSMHVAKSEVEEIKWVYNQISSAECSVTEIAIIARKRHQAILCRLLEKSHIPINNERDQGIYLLSELGKLPANIAILYWLDATEENVFPDMSMFKKRKQLRLMKESVSDYIFVSKVGSNTNFAEALIAYL